jgi:hypothetical protein
MGDLAFYDTAQEDGAMHDRRPRKTMLASTFLSFDVWQVTIRMKSGEDLKLMTPHSETGAHMASYNPTGGQITGNPENLRSRFLR